MAGFRGACRGVLGVQIQKLDADGTPLTGPGNVIVLPKEAITSIQPTAQTRTIAEIDEPCLNIPEKIIRKPFGKVAIEFCATTDFETIDMLSAGTMAAYGDGTQTWGVEEICAAASCFCAADESANGVAITVWGCLKGCSGGILVDPVSGDVVNCVRGYPKLTDPVITSEPGEVGAEGTPERWTIEFTAFANPNYGQGPGGVLQKFDENGDPAGPACWNFRGHTTVPAPIDCDVDCATSEVGYDTEVYALV